MTRRISGAVFWGLAFVVFGSLFLARNLGYPVPLWTVLARYWPVLLIVWGLFKLVDAFRMETGEKRSLFSGGEVAAVIIVIIFGSLITLAADMSPDLGKLINSRNFDVWDITYRAQVVYQLNPQLAEKSLVPFFEAGGGMVQVVSSQQESVLKKDAKAIGYIGNVPLEDKMTGSYTVQYLGAATRVAAS